MIPVWRFYFLILVVACSYDHVYFEQRHFSGEIMPRNCFMQSLQFGVEWIKSSDL